VAASANFFLESDVGVGSSVTQHVACQSRNVHCCSMAKRGAVRGGLEGFAGS
jgi:hypothetical protein